MNQMPKKKEKDVQNGISPIVAIPFLMTVGTILAVWLKGQNEKTKPGKFEPDENLMKKKITETDIKTKNNIIQFGGLADISQPKISVNNIMPLVETNPNTPNIKDQTLRFDTCYAGNTGGGNKSFAVFVGRNIINNV